MILLDLLPGLGVLVLIAIIVRLSQPEPPSYVDRDSPWLDRFERPTKGA